MVRDHEVGGSNPLAPTIFLEKPFGHPRTGEFSVKKGPVFANFVLADEINRAPAKVQSALLEAMQEQQVTIGDTTYPLEKPFLVLATQNPIEQEGTYHQVEGLSHFRNKTYADQLPVQTDDFEDSTFGDVICRKPLGPQILRKFKRFHGDVDGFVPSPVAPLDFQLQLGSPISKLGVLRGERVGVDLFEQPQIEQGGSADPAPERVRPASPSPSSLKIARPNSSPSATPP